MRLLAYASFGVVFFTVSFAISQNGIAANSAISPPCPAGLARLKTVALPAGVASLCELHDRYQAAKAKIAAQTSATSSPESAFRVASAIALRLIEQKTWQAALDNGHKNPWRVYQPAPLTWERFQAAATIIEDTSADNYRNGRIAPITTDHLQRVHYVALKNLFSTAGNFRTNNMDVVQQADLRWAATYEEVQQLRNLEYTYNGSSEKLIAWTPVLCLQELSDEDAIKLAKHYTEKSAYTVVSDDHIFRDAQGIARQCGYYGYAKGGKVKGLVATFLADVNRVLEDYNQGGTQLDPFRLAAHAQRRYVSIHPHDDGNGRMSRFIMDEILLSLGLPAPILKDMSKDIFESEALWTTRVADGVVETIKVFENCAKDMSQLGCAIVSEFPPAP